MQTQFLFRVVALGGIISAPLAVSSFGQTGPDVITSEVSHVEQLGRVGPVGTGTVGLGVSTTMCNIGDETIPLLAFPDTDHHVIVANAYRLRQVDGSDRFEQIGMAWVKHGFGSANFAGCDLDCSGGPSDRLIGGCADTYLAGQFTPCGGGFGGLLGPRSAIQPYTGAMAPGVDLGPGGACESNYPAANHIGHTHDGISHRIQVQDADLMPELNVGARYYMEGQYVYLFEFLRANGSQNNNVSHREIGVSGPDEFGFFAFEDLGETVTESPAVDAWTGADQTVLEPAMLEDGRGILAFEVTNIGGGIWHYEYAIYNMNLDRAFGSLSVPVPDGVSITNIGFHAPPAHAPELNADNYSSDPWEAVRADAALTWSTDSFTVDPLAGAVRYGTMYNFRFDADSPPTSTVATIGLFKTGGTISAATLAPRAFGPQDCNNNGIEDACDLDCTAEACDVPGCGDSTDCNDTGVPDECEVDCNGNGVDDRCDLETGTSTDCNDNSIPDDCDVAVGLEEDCDGNGLPDRCEADCNENGIVDGCDILGGTSEDCTGNGIPDECERDCNGNGAADSCDIGDGTSEDCTGNGVPDECEADCNGNGRADSCDIDAATSEDCNANGTPDECEPDCNGNGQPDDCDIASGTSKDCDADGLPDECEPDCNGNAVADDCDLAEETSADCNNNDVPDECEADPDCGCILSEVQKLTSSDGFVGDEFGSLVAIYGDRMVITAPEHEDFAGNPDAGAVYVFRVNDNGTPVEPSDDAWVQETRLTLSEPTSRFGSDVALGPDRAIVGYDRDDHAGMFSGAAFVFRREDNASPADPSDDFWVQEAKLTADDAAARDLFGTSVALDGERAVVAAPQASLGPGNVYVFRRSGESWLQEAKLSVGEPEDNLNPLLVTISGDRIAVASASFGSGIVSAVQVFRQSGSAWVEEPGFIDFEASFGASDMSISGDWVVVGDGSWESSRGRVWFFRREENDPRDVDDDEWIEHEVKPGPDSADLSPRFGSAVALSGDWAVIGAPFGLTFQRTGEATVYHRDDGGTPDDLSDDVWERVAKLRGSDVEPEDWFGEAVAISDGRIVVGASESQNFDDPGPGAAYVFDLGPDCNGNFVPDACDVSLGTSLDADHNGIPDECNCVASSPPELVHVEESVGGPSVGLVTNRVIALTAGDPGTIQRIRVNFVSLPPPWDGWSGTEMWVTAPRRVCDLPGETDPNDSACGSPFDVAGLSCDPDQAHAANWAELGRFYIAAPAIIPGGVYDVRLVGSSCDAGDEANFSAALSVTNSLWGDITGGFDPNVGVAGGWVAPDKTVSIVSDVVAAIAAFGNTPGNVTKMRADVEPCVLDQKINISDIVLLLDAFRGLPYPFAPGQIGCPSEPCGP